MSQGFGRALLVAGVLLVLPASGRVADNPEADSSPTDRRQQAPATGTADAGELSVKQPDLILVLYDPRGALPSGAEVMAREVEAIFAGLGVNVGWRKGGSGITFGDGPVPEMAVVLMPGDPRWERKEDHVMGHVLRRQTPNRAMWLFVSNVRWTLGFRPQARKGAPPSEWREVGVALGRVVAHELIHAVAPEEPHAEDGLMRHSLDGRGLRAKDVTIDARCARAFLAGLAARRAHVSEILPAKIVAGP